jgi:hypothetical protein
MSSNGGQRSEVGGRDRLDTAIDLAVREMLDVEPPAGLRGRVLDRIDALSTDSVASGTDSVASGTDSVASAFRRKFGWLAVPVAAAAVIILAVLAPWRHAVEPVSRVAPAVARVEPNPIARPQETPALAPSPRTFATPPSVMPTGQRPSPRSVQEHTVVAADVDAGDTGSQIEPLAPIAPITVAGTHPEDIAPKQIAISPLAPIAELQIAPLSPPERRN